MPSRAVATAIVSPLTDTKTRRRWKRSESLPDTTAVSTEQTE